MKAARTSVAGLLVRIVARVTPGNSVRSEREAIDCAPASDGARAVARSAAEMSLAS
jgi:hypothetical protein